MKNKNLLLIIAGSVIMIDGGLITSLPSGSQFRRLTISYNEYRRYGASPMVLFFANNSSIHRAHILRSRQKAKIFSVNYYQTV
jgi:hypothetical protein